MEKFHAKHKNSLNNNENPEELYNKIFNSKNKKFIKEIPTSMYGINHSTLKIVNEKYIEKKEEEDKKRRLSNSRLSFLKRRRNSLINTNLDNNLNRVSSSSQLSAGSSAFIIKAHYSNISKKEPILKIESC
jgi:hypothetical protein